MVRKISEQKAAQKKNLIELTRSNIFEQLKSTEKVLDKHIFYNLAKFNPCRMPWKARYNSI